MSSEKVFSYFINNFQSNNFKRQAVQPVVSIYVNTLYLWSRILGIMVSLPIIFAFKGVNIIVFPFHVWIISLALRWYVLHESKLKNEIMKNIICIKYFIWIYFLLLNEYRRRTTPSLFKCCLISSGNWRSFYWVKILL